jgi:hypothetical protein
VVAAALVAGCSGPQGGDTGAELWKAEFAAAAERATSDWEREALESAAESGSISDEDFEYAEQMYLRCMADRGVPTTKQIDPATGYFSYTSESAEGVDVQAIQQECSGGNGLELRALYFEASGNPDHRDRDELMAECLVNEGVVGKGYSGEDYKRDKELAVPPYDESSQGFVRCYVNPAGGAS